MDVRSVSIIRDIDGDLYLASKGRATDPAALHARLKAVYALANTLETVTNFGNRLALPGGDALVQRLDGDLLWARNAYGVASDEFLAPGTDPASDTYVANQAYQDLLGHGHYGPTNPTPQRTPATGAVLAAARSIDTAIAAQPSCRALVSSLGAPDLVHLFSADAGKPLVGNLSLLGFVPND